MAIVSTTMPARQTPLLAPSRNAPCPCGSGKKYKQCCLGRPGPGQGLPGSGTGGDSSARARGAAGAERVLAPLEQSNAAERLGDWARVVTLLAPLATAPACPRSVALHYGASLSGVGRLQEAATLLTRLVDDDPGEWRARLHLGRTLFQMGHVAAAQTQLETVRRLAPDSVDAHALLGLVLAQQSRHADALPSFERAATLAPTKPEALRNVALCLQVLGRLGDSLPLLRQVLAMETAADGTEDPALRATYLYLLQQTCAWEELGQALEGAHTARRRGISVPLAAQQAISLGDDPAAHLADGRAWATLHPVPVVRRAAAPHRRQEGRRLRVGYLSTDLLRQHATAHLMTEVLEQHDAARFEIVVYALVPGDGGRLHQRIRAAVPRIVDVPPRLPSPEVAARIAADEVDLLIEVNGPYGGRLDILAYRPAPVQAHYLAYAGTLVAPGVDYLFGDPYVTPPGTEQFYTERLVLLPDTYQPNDRKRAIAPRTPTREECGLPPEGFVWCSFNGSYKLRPDTWDVWMRLLLATPGSVLWLYRDNDEMVPNLQKEAAARGVDPTRLVFAPRLDPAEHLARYRLADLFLDSLPYNAHTTCSDALWAGCPVLTRSGRSYASRVAGSLLRAVGLPDLITTTPEEYEALALHLATHPDALARYRAHLTATHTTAPLWDTPRYVKHLEAAYAMMWEAYQSGEQERGVRTPLMVEPLPRTLPAPALATA